jgi:hypothetical protein
VVNPRGIGDRVASFVARGAESETAIALMGRVAPSAILAAALLPVIAIAAYAMGTTPAEYPLFGTAGANLLRGNVSAVFGSPKLQAGPFEIAPYGIAKLLNVHTEAQWFVFYVCVLYDMTFLLSLVLLLPVTRVSGRLGVYVPLLVLATANIGAFLPNVVLRGHLAEAMIPILWIVAACLSRERMFAAAGVAVALSAGFEVWGLLGAPVILLGTSPRFFRAALGGIVALLAIYLPFILSGNFRMFGFQWTTALGSIYRFLWPDLATFPWTFRLAQALLALAAGCAAALATRKHVSGVWLVPMAIISVRLVFDPLLFFYYWMAPATVALCALAFALYRRAWIAAVLSVVVVACLWLPPAAPLLTAILLAVMVALAVVALRLVDRHQTGTSPGV